MNTLKKDLRKIYLNRSEEITNEKFKNRSIDRHIRHMRKRLHEEFDQIWIKYNNLSNIFFKESRSSGSFFIFICDKQ